MLYMCHVMFYNEKYVNCYITVLCDITCMILCYTTCVTLCYITCVMLCYVI